MEKTIFLEDQPYDNTPMTGKRLGGVSDRTVGFWGRAGKLPPPVKIGKQNFYQRAEVDAHVLLRQRNG